MDTTATGSAAARRGSNNLTYAILVAVAAIVEPHDRGGEQSLDRAERFALGHALEPAVAR